MRKLKALGCAAAAGIAAAVAVPIFTATAVPPAKPSPTPTPTPTPTVAPYTPDYEKVQGPNVPLEIGQPYVRLEVPCPEGKYAVGGGYTDSPGDGTVHFFENFPAGGPTIFNWTVLARKTSNNPSTIATISAFAVCANIR